MVSVDDQGTFEAALAYAFAAAARSGRPLTMLHRLPPARTRPGTWPTTGR